MYYSVQFSPDSDSALPDSFLTGLVTSYPGKFDVGARAEVITKQAYPWKDFNCVLRTEERPLKTHGHIQIVTVE